jgi:dephospho-CoA kinase
MEGQKIIAILGLPGSGKSEVVKRIMEKYGWPKVYFGEVTFDELKARGLEVNEKNERLVREGLRAEFGQLHYAKKVIEKIKQISAPVILVESLYGWVEYLEFKEKFGKDFLTIAVHSAPTVRYERLRNRPQRPLTATEAWSRDKSQIENLAQAGPIAMADFTISNGKDLDYLLERVDEIVAEIT